MRGLVFTEFLEMVESNFGIQVLDKITSLEDLHGEGAYTSVGNYPHHDMIAMVGALSDSVGISQADLIETFGRYLFKTFARDYASMISDCKDSFALLQGIETVIHSEVRKLYPDASPPQFECSKDENDNLIMVYRSKRPFADLAEGLIKSAIEHYNESMIVEREEGPTNDSHSARFLIRRTNK